jgi:hypothetical protein
MRPYLKKKKKKKKQTNKKQKNPSQKRIGGMVQGVGPEFKPQYGQTTTTTKKNQTCSSR